MSYTDNLYGIEVKTKAKSLRKMVTFSIFGFVFLSFVYMLYWIGVMSDSTILDYTGKIFTPLAKIISLLIIHCISTEIQVYFYFV